MKINQKEPMKNFLAVLLLFSLTLSPVMADTQGQEQVKVQSVTANGSVGANQRSITFIFGSTFVGTIGGIAFTGGTGADSSLTITAQSGNTLGPVTYTVSAGTMRIVTTKTQ